MTSPAFHHTAVGTRIAATLNPHGRTVQLSSHQPSTPGASASRVVALGGVY